MSIVTYENVDTPVFEIDFLRYLFTNGAQGSLWGPLPYYSDAAGTVEADWGDPVGNIPDASGNGNDWTQVTSTARPILGRVPVGGRRNLVAYSDCNDAVVGVVGEGGQLPTGWTIPAALGLNLEVLATDIDPLVGGTRLRIYGTTSSSGTFRLQTSNSLPSQVWKDVSVSQYIRVSSGSVPGSFQELFLFGVNLSGSDVAFSGNEFSQLRDARRVCPIASNASPLSIRSEVRIRGSLAVGVDVDFTIEVGGAQIEFDGLTPYQRVGNAYDITEAGVKEIHYLRFDGTDDLVSTTLPAISGGTIVLAGTNGIWIDSLDFAGGAFSVGPDTYTGGPAGLMSVLGDLLVEGGFVIDRALTPEEIAKVKGYYVARGAGDLIEEIP